MIYLAEFRKKTVRNTGFTLIELMVTIAVISILATIAVPGMSTLMKDTQLKSAARELVSGLQVMKLQAIRENTRTMMVTSQTNGMYILFVDKDPGAWYLDTAEEIVAYVKANLGAEAIIAQVDLNDGLQIQTTAVDDTLGFNGRGFLATGPGTIIISNSAGRQKNIEINPMGHIRAD